MTRNHLLKQTLHRRSAAEAGVWRMTMEILGAVFGGPSSRREWRR